MRITFSAAAVDYLTPILADSNKQLKFSHDTEDCGCAVNGVPTLKLIDEPSAYDQAGEADPLPFYYVPQDIVYYEEHMSIDYTPQNNRLSLKSPSQVYKFDLRFVR